MKTCDLHTHSTFSDGTYTPTEIIEKAVEVGLSAVALCDHNKVSGLKEFMSAAKGKDIDAVAGTEFSVDCNGKEVHLLALYIPEDKFGDVSALTESVLKQKDKDNKELVAALQKAGYDISYERIKSMTHGTFNRVHIGAELTNQGYTESVDHAFATVLSVEAGFYKEPKRLPLLETIQFIKNIGAVPVLAHPFLNLSEEQLEEVLPSAKQQGLVGMECYYSLYDDETTEKAVRLAERFGLKPSGGSDFHGDNKPHIKLGVGHGNLKIPYEWAKDLKKTE